MYGPAETIGGVVGVGAAVAVAVAPAGGKVVAVDFGVDTNLSASPVSLGNAVAGAAAIAAEGGTETIAGGVVIGGEVEGTAVAPIAPIAPVAGALAAARFVDDGGAAGVRPAMAVACGVDCDEGSAGFAERAMADESSGVFSRLNHAKPGPDLQPTTIARAANNINEPSVIRFISVTAYATCAHAHSTCELFDGGAIAAQQLLKSSVYSAYNIYGNAADRPY